MNNFYEVELETGAIISPIVYTNKDWDETRLNTPLYENIKKEGIRIK